MPQMVKHETTWGSVRKGDRWPHEDSTPVADVNKKVAWTTLTFTGDDGNVLQSLTIRKRVDETVTVYREEPTDEEKDAQHVELMRDLLSDNLRKMLARTPIKALEAIIEKVKNDEYDYDVLTWANLPDVLKAQATYRQAMIIRGRLTRKSHARDGRNVTVEDATLDELLDAYAAWYYANVERSSGRFGPRVDPTSRSTSPISNLLEDLEVWAIGEMLYRITWSGAWEDVLARVEQFKSEAKNR
jgi:hypothetical protein